MLRFAVIGLGRFGVRLARNLSAAGHEVIAIDINRRIVEEIRDEVTHAVALDATDEDALRGQGVEKVDVAVISIGDDFEVNALATAVLKQMGVPRVISRGVTPMGAKILERIGADEIVNPETESADRWTTRLASPQFLNHYELEEGTSLVEMPTPQSWVGKTLIDLQLRAKYRVHVVAIKQPPKEGPARHRSAVQMPTPDQVLREEDVLVLMGKDDDLAKLTPQA
jgi:trk system potassium uptake protein TrkA